MCSMIADADSLPGERLDSEKPFRFHCHPGLDCFNTCCRNKRLHLYPYDVLRLRQELDLSSAALLERYAELEIDPDTGWPALRIRLLDDGRCPFVGSEGCGVYANRPTCCRTFPLIRAVRQRPGGGGGRGGRGGSDGADAALDQVYLRESTTGCAGWEEPRELTISQWTEEQGLAMYHEHNNRAAKLFLHPERQTPMQLGEQQIHATIMALYNVDVFRQAVKQPGFGKRFELPQRDIEAALATDEALLSLGIRWLIGQLFGTPSPF